MPRQSTAAVDNGQQLSLTYCDNSEDFLLWFVVVNRNYYWGNRNYYDNLEEFLPLFVVVKVNSTKNYQLNKWLFTGEKKAPCGEGLAISYKGE